MRIREFEVNDYIIEISFHRIEYINIRLAITNGAS